jgi:4-amino-4-deoxy-L-arabinose transferase-like glycosyltransferase
MRRRWLAGIFAVSAIFAVLVAVFSSDSVHRLWGTMAACGYALALVASLAIRHTRAADVALGFSFCGALLAPLTWMAAKSIEQPEVWVVARSGITLIHQGTPYASAAALAGNQDPNAYDPYLPVMALFGLPRAIFHSGLLTDPRVWFGIVFLAIFWLALRCGGARDPGRWAIAVAASPVIAFELAVGGTDVPMVAFLCLGFGYLYGANRATTATMVLAGLALGIAAAMKATAWPALVVAVVLIAVRDGRKAAGLFTLTALAVVAACVGPFLADPKTLVENTIKFPLGLANVRSAAASPLLGHIIASTWHSAGHTIVVGLLVAAAVGVALSLVFRPPRSVSRAVMLLAGAMTLMFVLAPSTRFGYFIYPATLAIWLFVVRAGRAEDDGTASQDPDEPPARSRTSLPTTPATRPAA